MDTILGLIGFLLGAAAVLAGYALGVYASHRRPVGAKEKAAHAPENAERERKELEDEQRAFRLLTGYNAEVAYGRESL